MTTYHRQCRALLCHRSYSMGWSIALVLSVFMAYGVEAQADSSFRIRLPSEWQPVSPQQNSKTPQQTKQQPYLLWQVKANQVTAALLRTPYRLPKRKNQWPAYIARIQQGIRQAFPHQTWRFTPNLSSPLTAKLRGASPQSKVLVIDGDGWPKNNTVNHNARHHQAPSIQLRILAHRRKTFAFIAEYQPRPSPAQTTSQQAANFRAAAAQISAIRKSFTLRP